MKGIFTRLAALLLAAALVTPAAQAAGSEAELIQVGLAYGSGALVSANLENNTGYGSGYRFGYYDSDLDFVELGRTSSGVTKLTMVKAQNIWVSGTSYSTSDNGGELIGCYHVQMPGSYNSYNAAYSEASDYSDGFVAWIDGEYQVRCGAYETKAEAESRASSLGGTVVGTSSYAVNVTQTGKAKILFQFDGEDGLALGVMPDVTGEDEVRTWFKGNRYYGGFRYERISGGDLTVVNIVDLETYLKGVIPYEMSNSWPLEALKVQAVCARSYAYNNLRSSRHTASHFDVCNTTDCQVYYGAGPNNTSYQANDRTDRAVEETAGEYARYDGQVIEAFYSSSHGGASESVYHVWGSSLEDYPYLKGVADPYEADLSGKNPYSSWTVSYSEEELVQQLLSKGYAAGSGIDSLVLTYSELGNVIQAKVFYENGQSNTLKPEKIRSAFGLPSIRFTVNGKEAGSGSQSGNSGLSVGGGALDSGKDYFVISGGGTVSQVSGEKLYSISGSGTICPVDEAGESGSPDVPAGTQVTVSGRSFTFRGSGNGHQLGLSQYGAWAMAERGFSYDEIIEFYYPGAVVR